MCSCPGKHSEFPCKQILSWNSPHHLVLEEILFVMHSIALSIHCTEIIFCMNFKGKIQRNIGKKTVKNYNLYGFYLLYLVYNICSIQKLKDH